MIQRLQNLYLTKVRDTLTEQFQYKNTHEIPRLEKIVINRDFIKKYSFDETIGGYYHPLEWKNSKVVKKKNKN